MNNRSEIRNSKSEITIVGAGPAGAGLAIRLAKKGFEIVLIEREKFPRHKLCGEFISPECLEHFRALEVLDEMLDAGGERLTETVFYAANGKSISVASEWFGNAAGALSLSRAEMDFRLLEKAKSLGVKVLEETQVVGLLYENEAVCGVKVKNKDGDHFEILSNLTIDATGRAGVLGKLAGKVQSPKSKVQSPKTKARNPIKLVGFKTHLRNVHLEKNRCEIYFFPGGYGGLSFVENNLANHCFLIDPKIVRKFNGQTNKIIEDVIFQNKRAFETMKGAEPVMNWLAVSVDGFGLKNLNPAPQLFSIGDAAAFIDPFTGSGMLTAFESAEILSRVICENFENPQNIAAIYKNLHQKKFQNRLRVCAVLRRAAFVPKLAGYAVSALSFSRKACEYLARSTRRSLPAD